MYRFRILAFLSLAFILSACSDSAPFGTTKNSFRALSTPNNNTIWLAGSNGFWARSVDGGENWDTGHVAGFHGEFRDIEAWDDNTAIAMGIESPGVLFKTKNGGKTWTEVFRLEHPLTFFDNMDFNMNGSGIVIGDPIDGKWTIIGTNDFGEHWVKWHKTVAYDAIEGDVAFAASGSGLIVDEDKITFFTGGSRAAVYSSESRLNFEIAKDTGSSFGIYSSYPMMNGDIIFVGGDYRAPDESRYTAGILKNVNSNPEVVWAETPPSGYRSSVIQLHDGRFLTTGPNGTDISNNGLHWEELTSEGFNVLSQSKIGNRIWAAGSDGRVNEITSLLP